MLHLLCQEIVVFESCKIICCCGLATERFSVSDLLDVTQTAGDALITVAVESIEVQGHPGIAAGIDFISVQDRFDGPVDDLRRGLRVCVDEPVTLICLVVSFCISVSERQLNRSLVRFLASELSNTILDGRIDRSVDCINGLCIALRNQDRYRILLCAAVNGYRLSSVEVRQSPIFDGVPPTRAVAV